MVDTDFKTIICDECKENPGIQIIEISKREFKLLCKSCIEKRRKNKEN